MSVIDRIAKFSGAQRRVVLTGGLTINSITTFSGLGGYESTIRQALSNQGFSVNSVTLNPSVFNTVNALVGVTIDLNVDSSYSAEQARQSALAVISTIPTDSYIFSGTQFSNLNLNVLSDGTAATTTQDQTRIDPLTELADATKKATGFDITTVALVIGGIVLLPSLLSAIQSRRK